MNFFKHTRQINLSSLSKNLTIVAFWVILVLPAIQMVFKPIRIYEVDEHRSKVLFPRLVAKDRLKDNGAIGKEIQNWFNDNYGLRDLFIRIKNQIDYSIFNKSDRIHLGNQGWMYYRNVLDVQKIQLDRVLERAWIDYCEQFVLLNQYLKSRGIRLIIMVIPLKDVIYPEHLPITIPNLPERSKFQEIHEFLDKIPDVVVFDAKSELESLKKTRQAYHKTDFHWTDPAAFHVARNLVELISKLEGLDESPWKHELVIEKKDFSGGQARFMPTLFPIRETSIFNVVTWQSDAVNCKYNFKSFREVYKWPLDSSRKLPTTVVKGDSFFDGMVRSGIQNCFKQLYLSSSQGFSLTDVINDLPKDCKYLIIETIDVGIGGIFPQGFKLPAQLSSRP